MKNNKKIALCIPAFKEEKLIFNVINNVPSFVDEIVIVWDLPNKNDLIKLKGYSKVKLIVRPRKLGVGSAIMTGINYCLENNFNYFIVMAGNGKDNPRELNRHLYFLNRGIYYTQGSRWLKGSVSENLPPIRFFITKLLALLWSLVLKKKITEVTNGYRGFNMEIFSNKRIKWDLKNFSGYELEYYLNYAIIKEKYPHCEVPISKIYVKNVNHSKIRLIDGFQIIGPLISMPIYHRIYNQTDSKT